MRSLQTSLLFIICYLSFSPAGAQEPWTLQRCIDHAVEHNITVRQQQQQLEQRRLQHSNARAQRLPDLGATASQNLSFGRGLTAENTYTNTNTTSTTFSVGTSVPLFTGFQIPNQIRQSRLNLEAATHDLERARNDIRMQVAQQYVQTLYDMEILHVARRQISIDSAQAARLQALLQVGRTSQAQLSQQQATLAQSRLAATQAQANLRLSLLALSQLLELDSPEGFSIELPDSHGFSRFDSHGFSRLDSHGFSRLVTEASDEADTAQQLPSLVGEGLGVGSVIPSPDAIFAEALGLRPEVQAEQLRLRAADHSIKTAQAGLYPTLTFTAGLGTNYYTTSGFHSAGFGRQLKNNFSQYLGLSLSIPIFNRLQTRNSIRAARLDRLTQQLQLDQTRKTLRKEIQTAYYNTLSAQEKLRASSEARRASSDAFALVQAKYEQGRATPTEFNEARANLLKAESDHTQARYELLYQRALLQFYQGEPLRF